jgi:hypothetical protein
MILIPIFIICLASFIWVIAETIELITRQPKKKYSREERELM